jgi:hypothetical protein
VLTIETAVFNQSQLVENLHINIKFPEHCFSELLEQEKEYDFKLRPFENNKFSITEQVYVQRQGEAKFKVQLQVGTIQQEFEEEKENLKYDFLKNIQEQDAIILYFIHCNEQEKQQKLDELIQLFVDGRH